MKPSKTILHREPARLLELVLLANLLAPGLARPAQQTNRGLPAAPAANTQPAVSATNDFIRSVRASPKLPPYRFVLKPDAWTDKPHPAPDEHIGRMEVFKGGSTSLWQRLEVIGTHPSWLTNTFHSMDINMDGYQDISVRYETASKWASHSYWLFDPKSGRFITNALTADLREVTHNGLKFDPKKKEIRASLFLGTCLNSFELYRIEKGRLVLLTSEIHSRVDDGRCMVEKRKRMNGKMVLVEAREREDPFPPGW